MAKAVEDAFRYGKLVLATTTYNADVFPFMKEFIHHLTERNFQNRTIGLMENGLLGAPRRQDHAQDAGGQQEPDLHRHHREDSLCPE